jgi:hypothetical protein
MELREKVILGSYCNNSKWDSLQKQNQRILLNAINAVVNCTIQPD